jgi:hypothetical protein
VNVQFDPAVVDGTREFSKKFGGPLGLKYPSEVMEAALLHFYRSFNWLPGQSDESWRDPPPSRP